MCGLGPWTCFWSVRQLLFPFPHFQTIGQVWGPSLLGPLILICPSLAQVELPLPLLNPVPVATGRPLLYCLLSASPAPRMIDCPDVVCARDQADARKPKTGKGREREKEGKKRVNRESGRWEN